MGSILVHKYPTHLSNIAAKKLFGQKLFLARSSVVVSDHMQRFRVNTVICTLYLKNEVMSHITISDLFVYLSFYFFVAFFVSLTSYFVPAKHNNINSVLVEIFYHMRKMTYISRTLINLG